MGPALEIMDITARKGGIVSYNDPHIQRVQTHYSASLGEFYRSVDLTAEALYDADCVVLTTNHDAFDLKFIQENARLIADMRNRFKESSDTVVYKL